MLQHDHSTSEITLKQLTTRQLTCVAMAILFVDPPPDGDARKALADSVIAAREEIGRRAPIDGEMAR